MSVKTIYYRGLLKFCNYQCGYCPFSKNPYSAKQLQRDQEALERFCARTEAVDDLGIMFLPYGEALVHAYYFEQMAGLSWKKNIRFLACQTNLSFPIDTLLEYDIDRSKLKLWCSFHPSQTSVDAFISQCRKLARYGIAFCVGAVGDPELLPVIRDLRARLDPDVYLWINDMDGKKRSYTAEEIAAFTSIDPLFGLELEKLTADISRCRAGKDSVFVNGKGEVFACNISNVLLGNIYEQEFEELAERSCSSRVCSCYLAYSNRIDSGVMPVFQANYPFRIPAAGTWGLKAFFFDVDGTLTDDKGCISAEKQKAIRDLAKTVQIYLATSLPYRDAVRKCRGIWDCLNGGAFAEGSDIRIFSTGYSRTIELKNCLPELESRAIRKYYKDGILHKITLLAPEDNMDFSGFHVVRENGRVGLTDDGADKLQGVRHICEVMGYREDEVAVAGNSENDIEMLKYFRYSLAVAGSSEKVCHAAAFTGTIEELTCANLVLTKRCQSNIVAIR